jgi:ferredoxin-thioredoxin reductase catalytic subunit
MTSDTTEEQKILTEAQKYAEEHGWVLNPDKKKRDIVVKGLARLKKKHGEAYCPCRLRTGDKEKDAAIICPCVYHKDEVETEGSCHCSLFFAKKPE